MGGFGARNNRVRTLEELKKTPIVLFKNETIL